MRFFLALLSGLFMALQVKLWFGDGGLLELHRLHQAVIRQELRNAQIQARNERLTAEVIDLKNGLDAIEERARTELGMIRSDEVFYLLAGDPGP